jgi:hemerythrin-like domain-containing protein
MAATDTYRRQHDDFLELLGSISPMLDSAKLATTSAQVRDMLSKLFGRLSVHLALEDKSLYPRCQQHSDKHLREVATKFANEMSGNKSAVEAFSTKWTESQIRSNAAVFCTEAKKLFEILKDRIRRENTELYTLLDKAG